MWGLVGLVNAAVGLWLLTQESTGLFVVARTGSSIVCTAAAVAVSTLWFRRVVARDDALAERCSNQGVRGVAGTGVDPVTPRFSGACSAD